MAMGVAEENGRQKTQENGLDEPIFDLEARPDELLDEKEVLFSIYNEIQPEEKKTKQDKEWSLRMTCTQEWFIRCSWINKYLFIEMLCYSTKGCTVIQNVLKSIQSIFSKDVLQLFSKNSTNYNYDRILTDDNRALDPVELNKAMKDDFYWFINLETGYQTRVIQKLIRLGGGGLIFRVYKLMEKIFNDRQDVSILFSTLPTQSLLKQIEGSKQKDKDSLRSGISSRSIDPKELESGNMLVNFFHSKKLKQLERREAEFSKYRKLKGLIVEESKASKKGETKEAVDYLQILPIWLNRRIMSYIDDKSLSAFKKVGKYWGKMIDESINEKSGRKAINAKINKIIGIRADKEEKKIEEKSQNEEVEFITELGAKELINKKNESKKELLNQTALYEEILSKKFTTNTMDTYFNPERFCIYDGSIGILACTTPSNIVQFYSVKTGAKLNFLVFGFESPITCMTLHENKIHMIFGCKDGSLISKDIRTNKTNRSFSGHTKDIICVHLTEANLLSASRDNTVKYFLLWSGLCLLCIDLNSELNISSVLLKNSKPHLAAIGTVEGVLVLVDIEAKKFLEREKLHSEEITQLAHDGDFLITGSAKGKIRVWNLNRLGNNFPSLKPFYNINTESPVSAIKFYKNQIFCGCKNGTMKIISLATGKIFKTLKISSPVPVTGVDITQDKLFMKLIIWHEKGIEIRTFSLQKSSPKKMSMERNNRENKQKAPKEIQRNKTSETVLAGYAKNNEGMLQITPNVRRKTTFTGMKRPLEERGCTVYTVRGDPKKCSQYSTDVFTRAYNETFASPENDFLLRTFPRCKNIGTK